MKINGKDYKVIGIKERMTIPDCFVLRANKIGLGNGEAKFYLANENSETRRFFGAKGFENKCVLKKSDLHKYLDDTDSEYISASQPYRNNLSKTDFEQRKKLIENQGDWIFFKLTEQTQINGTRVYAKSNDYAYQLIREISLPNISYLSAIKLVSNDGDILFYLRVFVDYFGTNYNPKAIDIKESSIITEYAGNEEEQGNLICSRRGQGKYRKNLLLECPFCPITMVSDERMLIASHIKPWVKSEINEMYDPKNGFMLTPHVDQLFDKGYITFTADKKLLTSQWLSKLTFKNLGIISKTYPHLPVAGREKYLSYHQKFIFKE